MSEIMTTEEVAEYLRTSVESIKRMARQGGLPAAKLGRNWRFRKGDIDDWLATGGTESEDIVTEGLTRVTRERMAGATDDQLLDWDEVRADLER